MFASKRQFRSSCHLCEKGFVVEVIGKNIQARSCLKISMAAFAMSMMVMVFAPLQAEAWTLHKSFSGEWSLVGWFERPDLGQYK